MTNLCVTDPILRSCVDKIDFAEVHGVLANRLFKSHSPAGLTLLAQTMHMLLDKKAGAMKQWNTEATLGTVSMICDGGSKVSEDVRAAPETYEWLCRLVEVVIKRHRVRLEGRFHLVVTVLQALLQLLIVPLPVSASSSSAADREKQAKLFARLLTLICEPSVASVTRGGGANSHQPQLDSATDAAKRAAGVHMYLVLSAYVKLQLEHAVPRAVREALQPGIYAVLDITTLGGKRILNEAVDGSGRAIFREMYRRYEKFGKWSGV